MFLLLYVESVSALKSLMNLAYLTKNMKLRSQIRVYITPETAICRNPPIHSFTGDSNNLTDPQ